MKILAAIAAFKRTSKYLATFHIIGTVPVDVMFVTAGYGENKARFYLALRHAKNPATDVLVVWNEKKGVWQLSDREQAVDSIGDIGCKKATMIEAFVTAFEHGQKEGIIPIGLTNSGLAELFEKRSESSSAYINTGQVGIMGRNAHVSGSVFNSVINTGDQKVVHRRHVDDDD